MNQERSKLVLSEIYLRYKFYNKLNTLDQNPHIAQWVFVFEVCWNLE